MDGIMDGFGEETLDREVGICSYLAPGTFRGLWHLFACGDQGASSPNSRLRFSSVMSSLFPRLRLYGLLLVTVKDTSTDFLLPIFSLNKSNRSLIRIPPFHPPKKCVRVLAKSVLALYTIGSGEYNQ